jgi:hypothetical protein
MKIKSLLVSSLLAGFAALVTAKAADLPAVYSLDIDSLVAAREHLNQGDAQLKAALAQLTADADRLFHVRAPSVLDKTKTAASGDKHDYFSMGPYWWPDPAKPDGLPYIRRDGETNPESKRGTDSIAFIFVCQSVETLGLAYYFTGYEPYADVAARLTRTWFIDPATRMNPNLQHAQAIPGITDGRGIGIIEAHNLIDLTDGLALLQGSTAWTEDDQKEFKQWLTSYYDWLTASKNGHDEYGEENNHGTWYDAQTAHLALVLGKNDRAKAIVTEALHRRLDHEIEPDGSQPRELARTKSLSYSLFNLDALFHLARLGQRLQVDWWNYESADHRSLRGALAFLAPYLDPEKPWIKKDLELTERGRILPYLREFLRHHPDAELAAHLTRFTQRPDVGAQRWLLTQ